MQIAELIVATHDSADPLAHPKVGEALSLMRQGLNMDVVFVSQFGGGRRTFKVVDDARQLKTIYAGMSDPIEETWCNRVVEGRIPEFVKDSRPMVESGEVPDAGMQIGTYMSTPIRMRNGEVYGTLCCFSGGVKETAQETDMRRLRLAARLIAEELQTAGLGQELELEPSRTAPAARSGGSRMFPVAGRATKCGCFPAVFGTSTLEDGRRLKTTSFTPCAPSPHFPAPRRAS